MSNDVTTLSVEDEARATEYANVLVAVSQTHAGAGLPVVLLGTTDDNAVFWRRVAEVVLAGMDGKVRLQYARDLT